MLSPLNKKQKPKFAIMLLILMSATNLIMKKLKDLTKTVFRNMKKCNMKLYKLLY